MFGFALKSSFLLNKDCVAPCAFTKLVASSYYAKFVVILCALLAYLNSHVAFAEVVAPQAPPELSDTLIDFRTKEQLTEKLYIEGKVDEQNSLHVPTVASDLKARVMRMSGMYQAHYEIAVPRYGVSVVRFYDLDGKPVDIRSVQLDRKGYIAEKTAAPYELTLRQLQGANTSLLQVKFKKYQALVVLKLRPMVLVNQQQPVRTLITSLTLNFKADNSHNVFAPYKLNNTQTTKDALAQKTKSKPEIVEYDAPIYAELEQNLLNGALVVLPLFVSEQVDAQEVIDKLSATTSHSLSPTQH